MILRKSDEAMALSASVVATAMVYKYLASFSFYAVSAYPAVMGTWENGNWWSKLLAY